MVIYSPTKKEHLASMPKCVLKYKKTRVVLDCTEIAVQKSKCLKCRIRTYSYYKSKHTIKFSVTPAGSVNYVSPAYGGRTSDKAIFNNQNVIDLLQPSHEAVILDKGFAIVEECKSKGIQLIRPPFTKGWCVPCRLRGLLTIWISVMPSKKKKYNARFPAGRIKKIMQTDEEVGKVAQAVPVIISRTLELFVESLLTKSMQITQARSAKTLTPSHMKQCILSESRFDFLKDLVKNIPDPSTQEDNENNANEAIDYSLNKHVDEPPKPIQENSKQKPEIVANFYTEQGTSAGRTPVIQYGPKVAHMEQPKLSFSIENLVNKDTEPKFHLDFSHVPVTSAPSSSQISVPHLVPSVNNKSPVVQNVPASTSQPSHDNIPPLIPISHNNLYGHSSSSDNNLYIDEDYDN